MRQLIKQLTPPIFLELFYLARATYSKHEFSGPFKTWKQAQGVTPGYSDERITRKLLQAANAVLSGEADFQRDGILLEQIEIAKKQKRIVKPSQTTFSDQVEVVELFVEGWPNWM